MADVMSHGGDNGGDLPRRLGKRIAGQCESDKPTKRRGLSRSVNLHKLWLARQKISFPIEFDIADLGTWQPVGKYRAYFTSLVGNRIKEIVVPCYKDWASVPEEDRTKVLERVQKYFDIRGSLNDAQYKRALEAFDRLAADRFRGYKAKAHSHYKLQFEDPSVIGPYGDISEENWQRCVDLFTSPEFKARSQKNSANRAKQKYPSLQGSKSLVAHRYDWDKFENEEDTDCTEAPGIITSFHDFHTNKAGEWVNEDARADFNRLLVARDEQMNQIASTGGSIDERAIAREVLGTRRGHERGVGRILKGGRTYSIESMGKLSSAANGLPQSSPTDVPDAATYAVLQEKVLKMERLLAQLRANARLPEDNEATGSNTEAPDGDEDLGGTT